MDASLITRQISLSNLAHLLGAHLARCGIDAVLIGEALVPIYCDDAHPAYDLEFMVFSGHGKVAAAMADLGFESHGDDVFIHPHTLFEVTFHARRESLETLIAGAGGAVQSENEYGCLRMLSPTQAVIERLADFYAHHEGQSLEQALRLASVRAVDLDAIAQWSRDEGFCTEYAFLRELFADYL